jgi:signal transduction histidine kinase
LDDLHRMMSLRARSKNLELRFEVDENLPRYLIADAGKLRQIAINLLGNAVKFTERGGITLQVTGQSLAAGGGRSQLSIANLCGRHGAGHCPGRNGWVV